MPSGWLGTGSAHSEIGTRPCRDRVVEEQTMRSGFTGRLASSTARHPWWTITVWVVALAAAFVLAGSLDSVLTEDGELSVTTESDTADDLIAAHFPVDEPPQEFVIVEGGGLVSEDALAGHVTSLVDGLRGAGNVASVVSYLDGAPGSCIHRCDDRSCCGHIGRCRRCFRSGAVDARRR